MGAKSFSKLKIEKLPDIRDVDVFNALSSMFWKIEKYVPSAWGEHIPFLFSLISFLKPRRFVELGVHNGGSFLAACQAVSYGNIVCECVAVDNWIGEHHAGFHSSDVFSSFLSNLGRYSNFGGYIRSDFNQAAEQFEDGSIDLLHIDGFHSEEAVQNDFDTWLPKMSDIGVIIFHDTNEFRAGFGVWRFWHAIREKYPYLEFGHCHGLGVLAVGKNSAFRQNIPSFGVPIASRLVNHALQFIAEGVGSNAWATAKLSVSPPQKVADHELTSLKQQVEAFKKQTANLTAEKADAVKSKENEVAALKQQVETFKKQIDDLTTEKADAVNSKENEVAALKQQVNHSNQEVAALRAEIGAYKFSTSWKITSPLRWAMTKIRR